MFKYTLVVLAVFGSALAFPLESEDVVEDEFGRQYVLVPIEQIEQHRVRRQTDYGVGSNGAFISHKQTLLNNNKHKVDGTVFAERQFAPKGPLTTGGKVDYLHKPSSSVLSLGGSNTRGQGTDLSASGQYNFLQSKNGKASLGAYGQYDRHLGGPSGNQPAQWQAGLRGKINF